MTWEELKEFASKSETYRENNNGDMFCVFNDLYFYKRGEIQTYNYYISEHITYEKMKAIIENLFDEEVCGFTPMCNYDCDCGVYHEAEDCEVIGNIHENPELLEKSDE